MWPNPQVPEDKERGRWGDFGPKTLKSSHRHQMCSIKKLPLKILQYSQENTCDGVSF